MGAVLALENLYDLCLARFTAEGTFPDAAAANTFGWREPVRQGGPVNRLIWVPGDPSGGLGEIKGPRYPYQNAGSITAAGRPLLNLNELFSVYVVAADVTPANVTVERAQYHAARLLYDAWLRAVYLAAHGTFEILSQRWIVDKTERRFGESMVVVGAILAVIPDAPLQFADVTTAANVTTTELDRTDPVDHITPS